MAYLDKKSGVDPKLIDKAYAKGKSMKGAKCKKCKMKKSSCGCKH